MRLLQALAQAALHPWGQHGLQQRRTQHQYAQIGVTADRPPGCCHCPVDTLTDTTGGAGQRPDTRFGAGHEVRPGHAVAVCIPMYIARFQGLQLHPADELGGGHRKLQGVEGHLGRQAGEGLSMKLEGTARQRGEGWRFDSKLRWPKGALYSEPLFVDAGQRTLSIAAEGTMFGGHTPVYVDGTVVTQGEPLRFAVIGEPTI